MSILLCLVSFVCRPVQYGRCKNLYCPHVLALKPPNTPQIQALSHLLDLN